MPRSADGLLADEESQLRSPSSDADDGLLRYEPGNTSRCGRRCNKCAGCLRGTWACCGELWCGFGPELCKLLCCPPLPSRIASKLAFAPPPPTYDVRLDEATQRLQLYVQRDGSERLFVPSEAFGANPAHQAPYTIDADWLRTRSKQHVPAVFLRPTRATRAQAFAAGRAPQPSPQGATEADDTDYFVLFFSHANGTDLGEMLELFAALVQHLGVGIYAYEYTGYGAATGNAAHESQVIMDATAAWHRLTSPVSEGGWGVIPSRVILYGQSIGSGPSTYLATQPNLAGRAAGLVLHSAFMSLIRVVLPIERTLFVDPFPNIERIQDVQIPVAIIHGNNDEMVPFSHGRALLAKAPNTLPPCWLSLAGHNDIAMFPEYYQYLSTTVKTLAERRAGGGGNVGGTGVARTMVAGHMPSEMRR